MINIILLIYGIGMVVALLCGCIQAYREHKLGYDITDLPGALSVMIILSWFYVIYFIINYGKHY